MALAVDSTAHKVATVGASDPYTWSHTCNAAANVLLILFSAGQSILNERTVGSASYNSVAASSVAAADDTIFEASSIWVKTSPSSGSNTVSVSMVAHNASDRQAAGYSISFTGAQTTLGASGTTNGTGSNPSTGAISTNVGDILVAVLASDFSNTNTVTSPGVLIFSDSNVNADSDFSAQYVVATGSTTTASWTAGSDGVQGHAVAYVVVQQAAATDATGVEWLGYTAMPPPPPPHRLHQGMLAHTPIPIADPRIPQGFPVHSSGFYRRTRLLSS